MSTATLAPPAPPAYWAPDAAYTGEFAAFTRLRPAPGRIAKLREAAFARFCERGFPTTKHEEYRQTNLAPVSQRQVFRLAPPPAPATLQEAAAFLASRPGADWPGTKLVFVDGYFAAGLSGREPMPAGLVAGNLAAACAANGSGAAALERAALEHLEQLAGGAGHSLADFNTAWLADGAWIYVAPGARIAAPVQIVHVASAAAGTAYMTHPRQLIVAGADSQAVIVESYFSLGSAAHLTNAVTEILAEPGAVLEHARLQRENRAAYHLSAVFSRQAAAAHLTAHALTFGGALTRNDVHAILDGAGAETVLNGLYVASGAQHMDNHTVLDHARPSGASREYYRGILDGRATTAFRGRIIVRPDAQHTDAVQSDKNLLLSPDCAANSDPQLEIRADDVRCTHGATFGQIDEEALFYLRSRGVDLLAARNLLIFAFAAEALGRLRAAPLRRSLERELFARWTGLEPPDEGTGGSREAESGGHGGGHE